jgi:hypothetical protein
MKAAFITAAMLATAVAHAADYRFGLQQVLGPPFPDFVGEFSIDVVPPAVGTFVFTEPALIRLAFFVSDSLPEGQFNLSSRSVGNLPPGNSASVTFVDGTPVDIGFEIRTAGDPDNGGMQDVYFRSGGGWVTHSGGSFANQWRLHDIRPIPEPPTLVLLLAGLAAPIFQRRHSR